MKWRSVLAWQIEFTAEAEKQLKKIDHSEARRIKDYLRQKIEQLDDPRQLGSPLTGTLSKLWRYRVGNYRLICDLQDDTLIILLVRIGHRKNIYNSNQVH